MDGYSRQPLLLRRPCKTESFRNLLSVLFFFARPINEWPGEPNRPSLKRHAEKIMAIQVCQCGKGHFYKGKMLNEMWNWKEASVNTWGNDVLLTPNWDLCVFLALKTARHGVFVTSVHYESFFFSRNGRNAITACNYKNQCFFFFFSGDVSGKCRQSH